MTAKLYEPDRVWNLANQVLQCAAAGLDATDNKAPDRQHINYGAEPTWDDCDCGLLMVHVPRMYPSQTFPNALQTPNNCTAPLTVAHLVVTILRCVPQPDTAGKPPRPDAINAAARIDLSDRRAVWAGVACCLESAEPKIRYLFLEQLAVGEQGACAGSETNMLVALNNCVGCD
jgi:hypothetical protein